MSENIKAFIFIDSTIKNSPRNEAKGLKKVFAVITNGYSDQKMTTDQESIQIKFGIDLLNITKFELRFLIHLNFNRAFISVINFNTK